MGKKDAATLKKRALARNPNQQKDFKKKRQKVGKKKQTPTNQTNTTVRAKRNNCKLCFFVLFRSVYKRNYYGF
jgi:hypothetical protein